MPYMRTVLNLLLFAMWILFLLFTLRRRWHLWITVCIYVGMIGIFFALMPLLPYELVELRQVIGIVGLLICSLVASSDRFLKILFVITAMFVSLLIGEVLSVALFPEIGQSADWPQRMTFATQIRFMLTYLLLQALLLFFAAILLNKRASRFSSKEWILFAFFPISQVLLLNFGLPSVYRQDDGFMQIWLIVIAVLCIGVDVALFFAIRGMSQQVELKAQAAILEQQIEAQKKHYAALTQQYEQMRRLRHDIANHVRTIQILLEKGDSPSAETYAAELLRQNQFSPNLGMCLNPIVDAFLYSRTMDLQAKGIMIETDIQLPAHMNIADTDLISILGNLLDNAEAACTTVPEKLRKIRLQAALMDAHLAIRMENSIPAAAEHRTSMTRIKAGRGLGFFILSEIALRYRGHFQTKVEGGLYVSMITLLVEDAE